VITGDAALTDHYLGTAPADVVLICGLFPHIAARISTASYAKCTP
jgi:hypothetical protein